MENIELPFELFDGRCKLLPCQKEQMRAMKDRYDMSYKDLSEQYGISKSEAYYICNPDAEKRKRIHNAKNSSRYYHTEEHTIHKRDSRNKKRSIKLKFKQQ